MDWLTSIIVLGWADLLKDMAAETYKYILFAVTGFAVWISGLAVLNRRRLSKLDWRLSLVEEQTKELENSQFTHADFEALRRDIQNLRKTRQSDINTIKLELEQSRREICEVNNGLKRGVESLENRLNQLTQELWRRSRAN